HTVACRDTSLRNCTKPPLTYLPGPASKKLRISAETTEQFGVFFINIIVKHDVPRLIRRGSQIPNIDWYRPRDVYGMHKALAEIVLDEPGFGSRGTRHQVMREQLRLFNPDAPMAQCP